MTPNNSSKFKGGKTALAEINVTPLVDVMLVLLIVFMVSAPLMQQGVEVNLPKAAAGAIQQTQEPIVISIQKDQTIIYNQKTYQLRALSSKLNSLFSQKPDSQILVQADESVNYGIVAKVMAELRRAKFTRVGLVTEPEK